MNRQVALLGALGAVLIIALWWLFLYSPGQDTLAIVENEIAAAQAEQASLQNRVAALEAVRARAPETEAAIAQLRAVVPEDPALPAALRQLSASAGDAGVEITAMATARPTVVDEGAGLYASAVNITIEGSYFQLVDFLRRVEDPQVTSRAVVFTNIAVASGEYPQLTVAMTGQMYSVLEPVPTPEDEEAAATAAATETTEEDEA